MQEVTLHLSTLHYNALCKNIIFFRSQPSPPVKHTDCVFKMYCPKLVRPNIIVYGKQCTKENKKKRTNTQQKNTVNARTRYKVSSSTHLKKLMFMH